MDVSADLTETQRMILWDGASAGMIPYEEMS